MDPGLVWSTFLGGTGNERALALALDAQGAATVAGGTQSADFPTTSGAFDPTHNGGDDAFITRLDMLPTGVSAYGTSSSGCTDPLAIGVTSWPQVGKAEFLASLGKRATQKTHADDGDLPK